MTCADRESAQPLDPGDLALTAGVEASRAGWGAEERVRAPTCTGRCAHFPDLAASAVWWYDAALAHKLLRNRANAC
ncbi:hypothetical protein SVIOM74S_00908 [Streptomyces violarus]